MGAGLGICPCRMLESDAGARGTIRILENLPGQGVPMLAVHM